LVIFRIKLKSLTDDQAALDFLQDEAGLVRELGALGPQHADQPILPQHVVLHPQLKEVLENGLHRLVLIQAAHVVKQNLTKRTNIVRRDPSSLPPALVLLVWVAAVTIELQVTVC